MWELNFFSDEFLPIKMVAEYVYCPNAALFMYLNWVNNEKNIFLFEASLYHERSKRGTIKHRDKSIQQKNYFIFSQKHKIYGFCDMIERGKDEKTIFPVEYKFGNPQVTLSHKVQLALEVLCLSEMFSTQINYGFIYFYKTNSRVKIDISPSLTQFSISTLRKFRYYIKRSSVNKISQCKRKGCSYFSVACGPY